MNQRWTAAGHAGEISSALYNRVRADVAIQLMEELARPVRNEAELVAEPLPVVIYQFKIVLWTCCPWSGGESRCGTVRSTGSTSTSRTPWAGTTRNNTTS